MHIMHLACAVDALSSVLVDLIETPGLVEGSSKDAKLQTLFGNYKAWAEAAGYCFGKPFFLVKKSHFMSKKPASRKPSHVASLIRSPRQSLQKDVLPSGVEAEGREQTLRSVAEVFVCYSMSLHDLLGQWPAESCQHTRLGGAVSRRNDFSIFQFSVLVIL